MKGNFTGTVTATFAFQHFKASLMLHKLAKDIEIQNNGNALSSFFEEIRSLVSASILSNIAGLEALINELYLHNNNSLHKAVVETFDFNKLFWEGNKKIERLPILVNI